MSDNDGRDYLATITSIPLSSSSHWLFIGHVSFPSLPVQRRVPLRGVRGGRERRVREGKGGERWEGGWEEGWDKGKENSRVVYRKRR